MVILLRIKPQKNVCLVFHSYECKQTKAYIEWSETKLKMADMKKKRQSNFSDLELLIAMITAVKST